MFSASVELLLSVAWREATARGHAHLTLEHLLYVLAHDLEGERILAACGVDLPKLRLELDRYLQKHVEQYPRGAQKEPEQTVAFRRVLQTAVLHVQSSGKGEVEAGDLLAALLHQPKSHAAQLLANDGVTRLAYVLNYISHGITKVPTAPDVSAPGDGESPATGGMGQNKILYSKITEDNPDWYNGHDLFIYDIDEDEETRLTNNLRANQPDVSNDGQKIVFLSERWNDESRSCRY